MAGLDTRGLASGFAQGFGLVNQYQQQQHQNERSDRRLDMQEQKFGLQMETAEMKREQLQRQQEMEELKFTLGKIAQFGPDAVTEEERGLLERHPEVWPSMDQRADPAIQRAIEVFDPKTSIDANDPESLEQANLLFRDLINKGEGGQKRIVGWVPGPDGESVMLELEVTREDGSTYRAPMTEGRGTEEDAIVKPVPIEKLVNHIQGLRMMRNGFNMAGPEAQQRANQMLQILRGEGAPERWERVEGPDGAILQRNTVTGELKEIMGREDDGYNYYSRPTSAMKEAQWLVQQGIAPDVASAYEMVRERAGQGQTQNLEYIDFLGSQIERIDEQLDSYQSKEDWPDLRQRREELVAELDAASRQSFNRPGRGGQEPEPQGQGVPTSSPQKSGDPGLQPAPGGQENGEAVKISGDEEYNALPPGALFVGPDGVVRRKP